MRCGECRITGAGKKKGINSYMVENMFSTGIWFGVDVGWEMA